MEEDEHIAHLPPDTDLVAEYYTPMEFVSGSQSSQHPLEVFDRFEVDAAAKSSTKKSIKDAFSRRFAKMVDQLENRDMDNPQLPTSLRGRRWHLLSSNGINLKPLPESVHADVAGQSSTTETNDDKNTDDNRTIDIPHRSGRREYIQSIALGQGGLGTLATRFATQKKRDEDERRKQLAVVAANLLGEPSCGGTKTGDFLLAEAERELSFICNDIQTKSGSLFDSINHVASSSQDVISSLKKFHLIRTEFGVLTLDNKLRDTVASVYADIEAQLTSLMQIVGNNLATMTDELNQSIDQDERANILFDGIRDATTSIKNSTLALSAVKFGTHDILLSNEIAVRRTIEKVDASQEEIVENCAEFKSRTDSLVQTVQQLRHGPKHHHMRMIMITVSECVAKALPTAIAEAMKQKPVMPIMAESLDIYHRAAVQFQKQSEAECEMDQTARDMVATASLMETASGITPEIRTIMTSLCMLAQNCAELLVRSQVIMSVDMNEIEVTGEVIMNSLTKCVVACKGISVGDLDARDRMTVCIREISDDVKAFIGSVKKVKQTHCPDIEPEPTEPLPDAPIAPPRRQHRPSEARPMIPKKPATLRPGMQHLRMNRAMSSPPRALPTPPRTSLPAPHRPLPTPVTPPRTSLPDSPLSQRPLPPTTSLPEPPRTSLPEPPQDSTEPPRRGSMPIPPQKPIPSTEPKQLLPSIKTKDPVEQELLLDCIKADTDGYHDICLMANRARLSIEKALDESFENNPVKCINDEDSEEEEEVKRPRNRLLSRTVTETRKRVRSGTFTEIMKRTGATIVGREHVAQTVAQRVQHSAVALRTIPRDNVWREPPDNIENIIYLDKSDPSGLRKISAANLNKLVERLTNETVPDLNFAKAFITTYHSFCTPQTLLTKLIERYRVPRFASALTETEFLRTVLNPIQLRVINVIQQWLEMQFFDFGDDNDMLRQLHRWIAKDLMRVDARAQLGQKLRRIIAKKAEEYVEYRASISEIRALVESEGGATTSKVKNALGDQTARDVFKGHSAEEVAAQIIRLDAQSYRAVQAREFLGQAWNKKDKKSKAKYLLNLIGRFNRLSNWVTCAVLSEEKVKDRAKMIQKFAKVAHVMQSMNDFSSMMAVLSGLRNSAVSRLKFTCENVSSKHEGWLKEMDTLMSPEKSFKAFRTTLHTVTPPCIPYIGVFLTDLVFIEDGNPDEINGMVNFQKRELVYMIISDIIQYQQTPYEIKEDLGMSYALQKVLDDMPLVDEDTLHHISQQLEPRGASKSDIK